MLFEKKVMRQESHSACGEKKITIPGDGGGVVDSYDDGGRIHLILKTANGHEWTRIRL